MTEQNTVVKLQLVFNRLNFEFSGCKILCKIVRDMRNMHKKRQIIWKTLSRINLQGIYCNIISVEAGG